MIFRQKLYASLYIRIMKKFDMNEYQRLYTQFVNVWKLIESIVEYIVKINIMQDGFIFQD